MLPATAFGWRGRAVLERAYEEIHRKHPLSAAVRQLSSARGLPSIARAAVRAGGFGGCRFAVQGALEIEEGVDALHGLQRQR